MTYKKLPDSEHFLIRKIKNEEKKRNNKNDL